MNGLLRVFRLAALFAVLLPVDSKGDVLYMLIDNGEIPGEVTRQGWEEWFEVGTFSHGGEFPFDPGHGTGQIILGQLNLTAVFASVLVSPAATPQLVEAVSTGRDLNNVQFKFVRGVNETEEVYFEIELDHDVKLTLVGTHRSGFSADAAPHEGHAYHELAFAYRSITWRYNPENLEYEYDRVNPPATMPDSGSLHPVAGVSSLPQESAEQVEVGTVSLIDLAGAAVAQRTAVALTRGTAAPIYVETGDVPPGLYRYTLAAGMRGQKGLVFWK